MGSAPTAVQPTGTGRRPQWTAIHDIEEMANEIERNVFVEQVAHRIDEDNPGGVPPKRIFRRLVVQKDGSVPPAPLIDHLQVVGGSAGVAPSCPRPLGHRGQTFGHALGVAVRASWAHLRAPHDRVPRRLGPFDGRSLGHGTHLLCQCNNTWALITAPNPNACVGSCAFMRPPIVHSP